MPSKRFNTSYSSRMSTRSLGSCESDLMNQLLEQPSVTDVKPGPLVNLIGNKNNLMIAEADE